MSDVTDMSASGEIIAEASAWIAQIESGEMTGADMSALREWMARSPAHRREIREIAALSGQLAALTDLAGPLEAAAGVASRARRRPGVGQRFAPALAAASVLMICVAAVFAVMRASPASPEIYRTAVGEYLTVSLEDGTSVKLNTDTQIEVDYAAAERRVRLVKGEAFFDVASNPKRPFFVFSENAVAEAVGTSFSVRLRDAVTDLAVVEGVVAFAKLPASIELPNLRPNSKETGRREATSEELIPAASALLVKAGQAVSSSAIPAEPVAGDPAPIPMISERDIQRKLSWTEGLLDFSETPLAEVVAEVSRHNPVTIEIADPALRELKFGGIFRTGDVEPLLEALERLGVEAERRDDSHIVLRRKA